MYYVFNKTTIGYAHLQNKKPCQDFSSSYKDNERIIITCCDGHGGSQYIRSHVGSKIASESIFNVFKNIDSSFFRKTNESNATEKIKLLILCEYNKLIENNLKNKPIRKIELSKLTNKEKDYILSNPIKAYGTTLSGAMLYKNKLIVVSIGDTEVIGFKKGEIIKIFDNSNDPVANITYSMCQEDAYKYLRVAILTINKLDGILLCTDGLSSPFQTYSNFNKSFLKPTVKTLLKTKTLDYISNECNEIALKLGTGDDVSTSFIINKNTKIKFYQ